MHHKVRVSVVAALAASVSVTGCALNPDKESEQKGTLFGAGLGAIIGYAQGGKKGALVGALAGGLIGNLIGADLDKKRLALEAKAKKHGIKVEAEVFSTAESWNWGQKGQGNKAKQADNSDNALSLTIYEPGMFPIGKATLTKQAKSSLLDIAKEYKESKNKVLIIGHTDSSGTAKSNQSLSEKRAQTVAKLFEKAGVPKDNIYYQGAGESQPVADNKTSGGRGANRRIQIVEVNSEKNLSQYVSKVRAPMEYRVAKKNALTTKKSKTPITTSIPTVDFNGRLVAGGGVDLVSAAGNDTASSSTFALISSAHASSKSLPGSCINDEPLISGDPINLASGKTLAHSTSEYLPGMYNTVWMDKVNNHLVAISPVAVLKDQSASSIDTKVSIYKKYSGNNDKADYSTHVYVSTYTGENGVVYRMQPKDNNSPFSCIDLLMPVQKPFIAKQGKIYYMSGHQMLVADFQPSMLKK